jgi:hypothetical protein
MASFSTLYFNLWHFFQFTDFLLVIYCGSFFKENKMLKYSQAISRVNVELKTNVSETLSVLHHIDPDDGDRGDL